MKTDCADLYWNTWRCRRNCGVFLAALAGFVAFLCAVGFLRATGLDRFLPHLLCGFGIAFVGLVVKWVRQARARRRERLPRSPLSFDEWRVARNKLAQYRIAKSL